MNEIAISGKRGHEFEEQGVGYMKKFEENKEEGECFNYINSKIK